MFFYVFFEKSIISRFRFQVYIILNYLKFENSNIFWGEAHRAPSLDPPRTISGFALDSGFTRFGPPTFEAWLRPFRGQYVVDKMA